MKWATCGGDGWEERCCDGLTCVRASPFFAICAENERPSALSLMMAESKTVLDVLERVKEADLEASLTPDINSTTMDRSVMMDAPLCGGSSSSVPTTTVLVILSLGSVGVALIFFALGWVYRARTGLKCKTMPAPARSEKWAGIGENSSTVLKSPSSPVPKGFSPEQPTRQSPLQHTQIFHTAV